MKQNQGQTRISMLVGLCYFWIFLFVCSSCSSSSSTVATSSEAHEGSQKSSDSIRTNDPLETKFFEGDPKGAEAWREFVSKGRYRLAQAEDFQFSDAAKRKLLHTFGDSWQSRVNNPYTGGEINHDEFYHDNAFIVVDMTGNGLGRFGLVIFNEEAGDSPHQEYWLFRGRDLSKTVFSWASSGLHIEEYNDEGESTICYVNWDKTAQKYSCDKSPKQ